MNLKDLIRDHNMGKCRYRNRYGDIYTFTKQKDGNVLWEGDFEYLRAGDDFIDPSGGPFIRIGKCYLILFMIVILML